MLLDDSIDIVGNAGIHLNDSLSNFLYSMYSSFSSPRLLNFLFVS